MKLRFEHSRDLSSILLGAACAFTFAASLAVPGTADAADRFGNIATRGKVLSGPGNEMIAGFIIEGDTTKCSVVRARGPSMGISGVLADPVLEVKRRTLQTDGSFKWETVAINDDWQDQEYPEDVAIIEDLGKAPRDAKEAAIFGCFEPNTPYTAIIKGAGSTTGIAIAEVLDADSLEELEVVNGDLGAMQAQIDDLTALVNSLQSQINGLATVASTGDYEDLLNKPSGGTGGGGNYTDADAVAAVREILHPVAESGSYAQLNGKPTLASVAFSGDYGDLLNTPNGNGGTNDALNYMSVVDGKLRISNIDLQVLGGNVLIGTGGIGSGLHNLVIGEGNEWDGNHNLILGKDNFANSQRSFIQGRFNYAINNVANAALLGGEANSVTIDNGTIVGGQDNTVTNAPFATITGGDSRQTSYNSEIIADG